MTKLNIALIPPPLLLTPPTAYGGLERVVYDLGCALVEGGDDVTLIAPRGSHIDGGKLLETGISQESVNVDWIKCEADAYNIYASKLKEFDIVHDHSWFGFPYLAKYNNTNIKSIHTHHGHLNWDAAKIPPQLKPINLVGISDFMKREYESQGWAARYVYNGIDLAAYPFSNKDRNGLCFVGRISKFKNPDKAIQAAIDTNQHIDVIGGSFVDDMNYLNDIKKMCANSKGIATLHLDLPHDEKVKLLQRAKVCLVPSRMKEPFGLTIIEACSTGCPVVALNDGAIREVVGADGVAGYVCNSYEEMVARIRSLDDNPIRPENCRKRAEMFSREKMAENYRKLYVEIMEGGGW